MGKFMLLYHSVPPSNPPSPEEMQRIMEEWAKWLARLRESGNLIDEGNPFGDAKRVNAQGVHDGPVMSGSEMVIGYTLIQAADINAAVQIAQDSPTVKNANSGVTVEVRQIMNVYS